MKSAPAKFLFDNDFAGGGESKPSMALAEHAQKVKDAETAAHGRGFAEAKAAAKAEAEQRAAVALERIAALLTTLQAGLAAVEARLETEAVEVAVAVAQACAGAGRARAAGGDAALATECFTSSPARTWWYGSTTRSISRARPDRRNHPPPGARGRLVVLAEPTSRRATAVRMGGRWHRPRLRRGRRRDRRGGRRYVSARIDAPSEIPGS